MVHGKFGFSATAQDVRTMIIGLLLAGIGIGIGISSAIVPLYISEAPDFVLAVMIVAQ